MNVIVDTSVWSLVLRRSSSQNQELTNSLCYLIDQGQVALLGAVRQEILSGIRREEQFLQLKQYLKAFPDLDITTEDYELAAEFFNLCRRNGIQGANTDFLICAVAHNRNYLIFTLDQDFQYFQRFIPLQLYE